MELLRRLRREELLWLEWGWCRQGVGREVRGRMLVTVELRELPDGLTVELSAWNRKGSRLNGDSEVLGLRNVTVVMAFFEVARW